MGLDFLVPVFGILLVMIPVLGLTTILTLRFGLKPFMESISQHLQGSGFVAPKALEGEVEELRSELEAMRTEVHRLQEAQAFDSRLLEGRDGASGGAGARNG